MYEKFYGLKEPPFNITPDPSYLYFSDSHRQTLEHLQYGVEGRKGFVQLTGEVGCGKTTVCRALLARFPASVKTAYILNPMINGVQLLRAVLNDLGIPATGDDHLSLIQQLNRYLLDEHARGNNVVVIIDEAQDLLPDVMEQVRLLSNLETDQHKLIQILLAGQPELEYRLSQPEMRQLRQRILVRCKLKPLSEDEIGAYIRHRLHIAGAGPDVTLNAESIHIVYEYSKGIPRLINALCDCALLAGYVHGRKQLGKPEMEKALAHLEAA